MERTRVNNTSKRKGKSSIETVVKKLKQSKDNPEETLTPPANETIDNERDLHDDDGSTDESQTDDQLKNKETSDAEKVLSSTAMSSAVKTLIFGVFTTGIGGSYDKSEPKLVAKLNDCSDNNTDFSLAIIVGQDDEG
ncbi:hypothetical protein KQX54_001837 [Cotesia glomerata]|uniref:Uncharacterized protein n=1 Tax=Cotesia glomerata TaxID=32391 RepID=A0AAV7I2L5_COTGL|nr:hypothetical protein KQX54_001837 [Cotesia glomerata]